MNVVLRLMEAAVEFLWWEVGLAQSFSWCSPLGFCGGGVGGVCTVIFMSNPTTVLRLCCVVVGVVKICVLYLNSPVRLQD